MNILFSKIVTREKDVESHDAKMSTAHGARPSTSGFRILQTNKGYTSE